MLKAPQLARVKGEAVLCLAKIPSAFDFNRIHLVLAALSVIRVQM
jgi:hypothetical protein